MFPCILGLDPAMKRLGWCLMRVDGIPIAFGIEEQNNNVPLEEEIGYRLRTVHHEINQLQNYQVIAIARESMWVVQRGAVGRALELAEVTGMAGAWAAYYWPGVKHDSFTPINWREINNLARNAPKEDVYEYARALGLKLPTASSKRIRETFQDAADAGVIANAYRLSHAFELLAEIQGVQERLTRNSSLSK